MVTYDPNISLKYIDSLFHQMKIYNLELLTKNLSTLLYFLRGQRNQSIGKVKIVKSILSYGTHTL